MFYNFGGNTLLQVGIFANIDKKNVFEIDLDSFGRLWRYGVQQLGHLYFKSI